MMRPEQTRVSNNFVASEVDVQIYDTTLRDGTQGEGISLSVADKMKLALALDKFGMAYIEGECSMR